MLSLQYTRLHDLFLCVRLSVLLPHKFVSVMHIKAGAKDKGEGVLAKGRLVGKSSFFRCPPGDQKITFAVDRNMINYTSP